MEPLRRVSISDHIYSEIWCGLIPAYEILPSSPALGWGSGGILILIQTQTWRDQHHASGNFSSML